MKILRQLIGHVMSAVIISLILSNIVDALSRFKRLTHLLVLSRDNIVVPLSSNPDIEVLTSTGAQMEEFVGEYFQTFAKKHKLISDLGCPTSLNVTVIANNTVSTIASAKAFVKGLFGECYVTIHNSSEDNYKQLFSVSIRNNSDVFIRELNEALNNKLENAKKVLHNSLSHLSKIININETRPCKEKGLCNLSIDKSRIVIEKYRPIYIDGPLQKAYKVSDTILSKYGAGDRINSILEGQFTKAKDLKPIAALVNQYYKIVNKYVPLAKDISRPLLKYIVDTLLNGKTRVTLLHGHQANLDVVATAMGVKSFQLQHYQEFPAGSRIVFQKWFDRETNTNYIRVDLLYMSMEQIRKKKFVDMDETSVPKSVTLSIEGCKENSMGLCPWNEFVKSVLS